MAPVVAEAEDVIELGSTYEVERAENRADAVDHLRLELAPAEHVAPSVGELHADGHAGGF